MARLTKSINEFVGPNIKYLRESVGMSREQLASKLNADVTTVGRWETGDREPNIEICKSICDIFNANVGEFITSYLKYDHIKPEVITATEFKKEVSTLLANAKGLSDKDKFMVEQTLNLIEDDKDSGHDS